MNIVTLILLGFMTVIPWGVLVWLTVLAVKALRKYLRSGETRKEKSAFRKSLGERRILFLNSSKFRIC